MDMLLRRSRVIALASLIAFAILAVGQGLWGLLLIGNLKTTPAIPWAPVLMALLLTGMVLFLAGIAGPKAGAEARRRLVRLAPVARGPFVWSMIGGGAGIVALAGLWIVLTSLIPTPPNALPSLSGIPPITLAAALVVSILAAPLTEEIAFRGYAMGMLQRVFSPPAALVVTSVLFALAHLTQGPHGDKLLVYFLAGLAFGFIAWRTGSMIPAMIVHAAADLTFFTLVWPHDAARFASHAGPDAWFWMHVAQIAVFGAISLYAFVRLAQATSGAPRFSGRGMAMAAA